MNGRVERAPFGRTHDGTAVDLYTLTNTSGLCARIATYGATLVSLEVPDRAGGLADVVLGFDALEPYLGDHPYFGCVIGRFANRIRGGTFSLDGTTYVLPRNDGAHHLHGGPGGFHRGVWTAAAERKNDAAELTLHHRSASGEQGYPGSLDVEVRYALTESNELRLDYRARTDAPTIVNLTNHAYFNLAGRGTVLEHTLRVRAARFLPVDSTLIPLGELRPVAGTPFDFTAAHPIGSRIAEDDEQIRIARGYDHTWVLDRAEGECALAADLSDPLTGRAMSVWTTQPGVQIYTGNFLDGTLQGKGGTAYPKHAGVCIETQHFPDSPNQPAFPSTVLQPNTEYRHATVYRFATATDRT
jgi:aldose 1-epimerase